MSDSFRPPQDLADRLAVVTGAARGIGRAIASGLSAAGARVIAVDRDAKALQSGRTDWIAVEADMARHGEAVAEEIVRAHGPIELIVNNVGITTPHHFLSLKPEDLDLVFNTNLRGPWLFTRILAQALVDSGRHGSILFISSLHDTFLRLNPHYSASKAGIAMLTKELAYELGPNGVRVNSVSPGWINATNRPLTPTDRQRENTHVPLGRVGTPEDIARIAVILLSDASAAYVTGVNLRVDGGLSLHDWLMDWR